MKSWLMFYGALAATVVIGLWVYRKINPEPKDDWEWSSLFDPKVYTVPSGGAGVQSTVKGVKLNSSIEIGPTTVKPAWDWDGTYDPKEYQ